MIEYTKVYAIYTKVYVIIEKKERRNEKCKQISLTDLKKQTN